MRRPETHHTSTQQPVNRGGEEAVPHVEKRRAPRKPVSTPALIGIPGMRMTIPCRLLDTSGTGYGAVLVLDARSRIRSSHDLPDIVTLIMPHERTEIDCAIQWRDGTRLGAAFRSRIRPHVPRPL